MRPRAEENTGHPHPLLSGMRTGGDILKKSLAVSYKLNMNYHTMNYLTYLPPKLKI